MSITADMCQESLQTTKSIVTPGSGFMSASSFPNFRIDESTATGVLLVSPSSRLRREMREKLKQGRWNLTEAASGAEALECLQKGPSEILLLDPLLTDIKATEFSALGL